MMFITRSRVRIHDTDMAGILYFPRIYRFANDAMEDLLESEGLGFQKMFTEEEFVFVIVHSEADYYSSLRVGDEIEIQLFVEKIGQTSFSLRSNIYKFDQTLIGRVLTVHCVLDRLNRKKITIPPKLRQTLDKYAIEQSVL